MVPEDGVVVRMEIPESVEFIVAQIDGLRVRHVQIVHHRSLPHSVKQNRDVALLSSVASRWLLVAIVTHINLVLSSLGLDLFT